MSDSEVNDDGFGLNSIFPDAEAVFSFSPKSVKSLAPKAWVALDTNILLAPYRFGSQPFTSFVKILSKLREEGRLFIPAHVAREYARRRQSHLAELIKSLSDNSSRASGVISDASTAIDDIDDYKKLKEINEKIILEINKAQKIIKKIDNDLRETSDGDPILRAYRKIFSGCVIEPEGSMDDIRREADDRIKARRPPGYKDGAKSENSEGDFLIWKSILGVGRREKVDIIFVTGDEKSDWFVRSNKKSFQPRCELVAEYAEVSEGRTIDLVAMHTLMKLFDAPAKDVEAARVVEVAAANEGRVQKSDISKNLKRILLSQEASNISKEIERINDTMKNFAQSNNDEDNNTSLDMEKIHLLNRKSDLLLRYSKLQQQLWLMSKDNVVSDRVPPETF
ncbi:PIN domain-containing protein [Caulobacter sp. RHG1]|uniref:PIN domain-containing protein n=1 Tax=Caulobacter sp. (strain RHG1) TaxID=2545762 RepID=UPI001551EC4B|nr:PIN domain-containing protein [Caulobacter sp. RHG1]NQE62107.1 hypothetical protein [Caulobacter sp. RHG1]